MRSTTPSDQLNQQISLNEQDFRTVMTVEHASDTQVFIGGKGYVDLGHINPYTLIGHGHNTLCKAITQNMYAQVVVAPWQPTSFPSLTRSIELLTGHQHTLFSVHAHPFNAIEEAIRSAYTYWMLRKEGQRKELMCFSGSFFGHSLSLANCNKEPCQKHFFSDMAITARLAPYPYTWALDPSRETKERIALDRLQSMLKQHHEKIIAFVFEPLVNTQKGLYTVSSSFLNQALELIASYGILLIADERFLGPYRTGKPLAYQHLNRTPDIVVIGSTLTNGIFPFGCTLHNKTLKFSQTPLSASEACIESPAIHPVVCSLVSATCEVVTSDPYQKAIKKISNKIKAHKLALSRLPVVSEVRYIGCLAAFKLANEKQNHGEKINRWLLKHCKEKGILLSLYGDSIGICPPLHPKMDVDHIFHIITDALHQMPLQYLCAEDA